MRLRSSQSRSAAPFAQSPLIGALCLLLAAPKVVISATTPDELDHLVVAAGPPLDGVQRAYEPEFGVFDRSIIGRAPLGVTALRNNIPESLNLSPGTTACYVVSKEMLFGNDSPSRRQTDDSEEDTEEETPTDPKPSKPTRNVYLSANTCLQPRPRSIQDDKPVAQPPQLVITISQSEDGGCARALADVPEDEKKRFEEGAVMIQANATGDLYVGIVAPEVDDSKFNDVYNFELTASTDSYYHTYSKGNSSELLWMDSDSSAVLLVTRDLTSDPNQYQKVMKSEPPYALYAENEARNHTGGLRASVCGLRNNAQILANGRGDGMLNQLCRTGMTTRGPGGHPKQQFYFHGLNATSKYTGILYKPPTLTGKRDENAQGGGGTIFPSVSFQTVQGRNCKVLDGAEFEFCDEVNWAMPGNDDLNSTELVRVYDNYARDMYENFKKVLMQIPCEAPADQQYSLARTCSDCETAYKRWLCTVAIPRCEDVSSTNPHAVLRNAGDAFPNGTTLPQEIRDTLGKNIYFNSSRNRQLNDAIKPGPYKEILPCDDICYEVVQSCPAAMQFACPRPGWTGFNTSYAERGDPGDDQVRCSFPGQSRTRTSIAAGMLSPASFSVNMLPLAVLFAQLL